MEVGDRIQGTRRQERNVDAVGFERVTPAVQARSLPTGESREVFLSEIRKLPCNTECHIPVSFRDRFAAIMASMLEGIGNNDVDACFLEESRSKLLLSPIPKSRNTKVELSVRLKI